MTTPQPTSTREAAINPNVLLGVLLTEVLAASIMGFFHLDAKVDSRFSTLLTARLTSWMPRWTLGLTG